MKGAQARHVALVTATVAVALAAGLMTGGGRSIAPSPAQNDSSFATSAEPGTASASLPLVAFDTRVQLERRRSPVENQLLGGVTHTYRSADSFQHPVAVDRARALLQPDVFRFQNQHIMGWGAMNPEPSPGRYDWESLDARLALIRSTGGEPVITLCCAPDWMKGGRPGTTDWGRIHLAPQPQHYADFAELARQVALRYPDVRYYQVWNEMRGFHLAASNRWDYEGYTEMYNQVYRAVKSVNPNNQVGGPYIIMEAWMVRDLMSHPASESAVTNRVWGTLDQRVIDVFDYWLAHADGADFVSMGTSSWYTHDGVRPKVEHATPQKFRELTLWLRARTDLPIWWTEWSVSNWDNPTWSHHQQAAMIAYALAEMSLAGAAVQLRWQPEGVAALPFEGDQESVWSDTKDADGGRPFPAFDVFRLFAESFPPGTDLWQGTSTIPQLRILASQTQILLINTSDRHIRAAIGDRVVPLGPFEVRLVDDASRQLS